MLCGRILDFGRNEEIAGPAAPWWRSVDEHEARGGGFIAGLWRCLERNEGRGLGTYSTTSCGQHSRFTKGSCTQTPRSRSRDSACFYLPVITTSIPGPRSQLSLPLLPRPILTSPLAVILSQNPRTPPQRHRIPSPSTSAVASPNTHNNAPCRHNTHQNLLFHLDTATATGTPFLPAGTQRTTAHPPIHPRFLPASLPPGIGSLQSGSSAPLCPRRRAAAVAALGAVVGELVVRWRRRSRAWGFSPKAKRTREPSLASSGCRRAGVGFSPG